MLLCNCFRLKSYKYRPRPNGSCGFRPNYINGTGMHHYPWYESVYVIVVRQLHGLFQLLHLTMDVDTVSPVVCMITCWTTNTHKNTREKVPSVSAVYFSIGADNTHKTDDITYYRSNEHVTEHCVTSHLFEYGSSCARDLIFVVIGRTCLLKVSMTLYVVCNCCTV